MLEIKDLKQTYFYGTTAIDNFSLSIAGGEKIAILSKSGGGKTSLLKCIAGLFPASEGSIILDGKDITNLKTKDRNVRLVYDDGGLIRKRTVKFNLEYPLKLKKIDKDERRQIAYEIAKKYGLEPFYKEHAFRLFEPEIISLALARTELTEVGVTLIDNVFALLNGVERRDTFNKYLETIRNIKGAVIFATDSVEEALSFGDRVVVLNSSFHQQTDTPYNLKANPLTLSVDELVNPEKTRLVVGVVNNVVEIDNITIKLPDDYNHDEVILSYNLKPDESGAPFNVKHKTYLGAGIYKFVNEAGDSFVLDKEPCNINVSIDTESLKLYDRVNEKLLTYNII